MHCLNSNGTGDLSLLRYKPDFVTSLFAINELYCILWRSVLFVEETGIPGENHRPVVSH
jgi:hypothetical protein